MSAHKIVGLLKGRSLSTAKLEIVNRVSKRCLPIPASLKHHKRLLKSSTSFWTVSRQNKVYYTCATTMAGPEAMRRNLSPVQLREQLRKHAATESFRVAGVSFEDRQELIATVSAGDAVMLQQEPENIYDPNAVSVRLLDGKSIGYVPRDVNANGSFEHAVSFGHVASVGPAAESGLLGLLVTHIPTLPPLVAEPIPLQLQAACLDLLPYIQSKTRHTLERDRPSECSISGSSLEPPVASLVWRSDPASQKVILKGFVWLAPQLRRARELLLLQGPLDREAGRVFQAMNGWTLDELLQYRQAQQDIAKERSDGTWKFDLEWLEALKIRIPNDLPSEQFL